MSGGRGIANGAEARHDVPKPGDTLANPPSDIERGSSSAPDDAFGGVDRAADDARFGWSFWRGGGRSRGGGGNWHFRLHR
jgi:hypothetical protein